VGLVMVVVMTVFSSLTPATCILKTGWLPGGYGLPRAGRPALLSTTGPSSTTHRQRRPAWSPALLPLTLTSPEKSSGKKERSAGTREALDRERGETAGSECEQLAWQAG